MDLNVLVHYAQFMVLFIFARFLKAVIFSMQCFIYLICVLALCTIFGVSGLLCNV